MAPPATPHPASTHRTALLVIDTQQGLNTTTTSYYGTTRSNPSFEANLTTLLAAVRAYNAALPTTTTSLPVSILHVHHHSTDPLSPLHPSKPSCAPQPCAAPLLEGDNKEPVLTKSTNSAFVGTDLEARLRALNIAQLLVVGIATDHCVSTTVRMAADLQVCSGSREGVWLVEDCTACFDNGGSYPAEVVQGVSVESLSGEFCAVTRVEGVREGVLR